MGRSQRDTYRSEQILGELYRIIDPTPQLEPSELEHFDVRLKQEVPRFYLGEAGKLKVAYDVAVTALMRRYAAQAVSSPWVITWR